LPVSFVNGITPEIEARLAEEGITNIANLAYADPVALIKNTVYSRNQIINWMDQALLIDVMPEGWQALRRCGVSGVLDLIASKDCEDAIGEYAAAANIKPAMLKCLIKRLDEDQQVNILKALYKDPEQTGLSATGAPKPPAAGAAAPPATPPKP
jgi:hypothetical protein